MDDVKTHYLYQRRMLGALCTMLAPLSVIFGLICSSINNSIWSGWWNSISETYYATSKVIMIGVLCSAASFFVTYTGYDKKDRIVNIIAGLCCLGVAAFPCGYKTMAGYEDLTTGIATTGLFALPLNVSNIFHCTSAALLFALMGVDVMFLFTKTADRSKMTKRKKIRNIVYYILGALCFAGLIGVAARSVVGSIAGEEWNNEHFPRWWIIIFEHITLMSFGIAFLIKGESFRFLNDE